MTPRSLRIFLFSVVLSIDCVSAQEPARKQENPEPPAAKAEIEPVPPAAEPGPAISATSSKEVKSSTESAAAQRNENVYILRIDNNAVKESLQRLGASVTIVDEPRVTADYYAAELGQPAAEFPFLKQVQQTGWHGELYESHQNSVLNARTFFQVGAVKPSHQNHYGFLIGGPVDARNAFTFEGGQRKIRGNVNGNVLVPAAGEREPLTPDVEKQAVIRHFLSAYPNELPNRPDFDPRALNTNSPQSIDEDRLGGRWDLSLSARRRLMSRYFHQTQYIRSFQPRSYKRPAMPSGPPVSRSAVCVPSWCRNSTRSDRPCACRTRLNTWGQSGMSRWTGATTHSGPAPRCRGFRGGTG